MDEKIEVDLWTYKNQQGATLQDALDFLLPVATGKAEWSHQQISPIHPESLIPHLILAGKVYDPQYAVTAQQLMDEYGVEGDYALYCDY